MYIKNTFVLQRCACRTCVNKRMQLANLFCKNFHTQRALYDNKMQTRMPFQSSIKRYSRILNYQKVKLRMWQKPQCLPPRFGHVTDILWHEITFVQ